MEAIKGRRRESANIGEARIDFQSHFSRSFFCIFFKDTFLGSLRGVKTYSEQKTFLGQNFKSTDP